MDIERRALYNTLQMLQRRGYRMRSVDGSKFVLDDAVKTFVMPSEGAKVYYFDNASIKDTSGKPVDIIVSRTKMSKIEEFISITGKNLMKPKSPTAVLNQLLLIYPKLENELKELVKSLPEVLPVTLAKRGKAPSRTDIASFAIVNHIQKHYRPIILYTPPLTADPEKESSIADRWKSYIEFWNIRKMLVDHTKHILSPVSTYVIRSGSEEHEAFTKAYDRMPLINASDPLAKYYQAMPGDLLHMTRGGLSSITVRRVKDA